MNSQRPLLKFIPIFGLLYNLELQADPLLGITTDGLPSTATFSGAIERNDTISTQTTFDIEDKLNISFNVKIAPEHIGKLGYFYTVANYQGHWYTKTTDGWREWNLVPGDILPIKQSDALSANEIVTVEKNLSGLLGNFDVYVGYRAGEKVHYNEKPFNFKVSLINSFNCVASNTSPIVISVKEKGAVGDGKQDDTNAIQTAINQVANTGGTVIIPDGTYRINALKSINLKSNMTIRMLGSATLQAIPNNQDHYDIFRIDNASNINIIGGALVGERDEHLDDAGEWGMGLGIYNGSNIVVEKVTSKNNWGDGFYIGSNSDDQPSKNITFCSVIADNNRRQGMSITNADKIIVKDSVFKNTNGTAPEDGIDVEPSSGENANDVQILNSQLLNNNGSGIEIGVPVDNTNESFVTNVTVKGNTVVNNNITTTRGGIYVTNTSGHLISSNIVKDNMAIGIFLTQGATQNTVDKNDVTGNKAEGILLYRSINNTITNNTVSNNKKPIVAILDEISGGNTISGNSTD